MSAMTNGSTKEKNGLEEVINSQANRPRRCSCRIRSWPWPIPRIAAHQASFSLRSSKHNRTILNREDSDGWTSSNPTRSPSTSLKHIKGRSADLPRGLQVKTPRISTVRGQTNITLGPERQYVRILSRRKTRLLFRLGWEFGGRR